MLLNYNSLQLCLVVAIGFWLICVIQVCIGLSMLIESQLPRKREALYLLLWVLKEEYQGG